MKNLSTTFLTWEGKSKKYRGGSQQEVVGSFVHVKNVLEIIIIIILLHA